jgi:hypothetical protein
VQGIKRAVELRSEARRLRSAMRRLTGPTRHDGTANAENPGIRSSVEHCRALLAKGVPYEPQRHLIEELLRYMEKSVVASARTDSAHQLAGVSTEVKASERRLQIVARELRGYRPSPTSEKSLRSPAASATCTPPRFGTNSPMPRNASSRFRLSGSQHE